MCALPLFSCSADAHESGKSIISNYLLLSNKVDNILLSTTGKNKNVEELR